MHGGSIIFDRSACPKCDHQLAWYHLIPILSWLFLGGRCAFCKNKISLLYPFIELLTACVLTLASAVLPADFLASYILFFSALIVTIRTDLETFMISRFMTLFCMPIGFGAAAFGYLPITLSQSFLGAAGGYFFLFAISWLYYSCTKRVGLGQGDVELLGMIGAFIGTAGWWITLMIGSLGGSLIGTLLLALSKPRSNKIKIPFGPFLAAGAIAYVFYAPFLTRIFLGS